jgi:hypothetical protein
VVPKEKITITQRGLQIKVPAILTDDVVTLNIPMNDVTKVGLFLKLWIFCLERKYSKAPFSLFLFRKLGILSNIAFIRISEQSGTIRHHVLTHVEA